MKPLNISSIALIFLFFACKNETKSTVERPLSSKTQATDSLVQRYVQLKRFGGAVLVAQNDSIIFHRHYGLADRAANKAFSKNTAFKIGRITALFTAYLIEKMTQEGMIAGDDRPYEHIPKLAEGGYSISDLVRHRSGLPSIASVQEKHPELPYSTIAYANLSIKDSVFNKGQSNLGYNILGILIEKKHRSTYQQAIEKYCAELELDNTFFQKENTDRAIGYQHHNYRGQGLEFEVSPEYDTRQAFSSTGLKSTAKDVFRLTKVLPLKEIDIHGYTPTDGFSYSLFKAADPGLTIVVLSNQRHPVSEEMVTEIRAIFNGKAYRLPLLRETVAVAPEQLQVYAGTYRINPGFSFEIKVKGNQLWQQVGPTSAQLFPQSQEQFYLKEADAALRFLKDSTGQVYGAELLNGFLDGQKIKKVK